jgi:hypothetical protein
MRTRQFARAALLALALVVGIALLSAAGASQTQPQSELQRRADQIAFQIITEIKRAQTGGKVQMANPNAASTSLQAAGVESGSWYKQCTLPTGFNPLHASQQPDGTMLFPIGSANSGANFDAGTFVMYRFNPSTCTSQRLATPVDMFCNVHVKNRVGNTYVLGGTGQYDPFHGLATLYEYDWKAQTFIKRPSMSGGRWYPSAWYRYSAKYGSSGIFTLTGLNEAGALNTKVEFYSEKDQRWYTLPYQYAVGAYAHGVPTKGNKIFLSGEGYGASIKPGFLDPGTGAFNPVAGLPGTAHSQGATFFAPGSNGATVVAAGGATTAVGKINLYSTNQVYIAIKSLAKATRYLSSTPLWDGRRILAGGEDTSGNPVYDAYLFGFTTMSPIAKTAYSHQYHSTMWTQPSGRPCLAGGNPRRGVVQPAMECFKPWYDSEPRPVITSAPSVITRGQAFSLGVTWPSGTTRGAYRIFPLKDTTHQFDAQSGDYTLTLTTSGGIVNTSSALMPPGYYFLVAVDSRGVPSQAVIRQLV